MAHAGKREEVRLSGGGLMQTAADQSREGGREHEAGPGLTMKTDRRRHVEMAAEMSLAMPYSRTVRRRRRPRGSCDLSLGLYGLDPPFGPPL